RKELAEKEAREMQEAEEKKRYETSSGRVTRGTMVLSLNGNAFNWSYTGKAVHGYKLVYSKKNDIPSFGSSASIYFGSISDTSGSLPDKSKIGAGKYYVRVCAYTAGTEDDPCVDYSNIVIHTI